MSSTASAKTIVTSVLVALGLCLALALAPAANAGKTMPRLWVFSVKVSSTSVEAGKTIQVTGTLRNSGRRDYGGGGTLPVELRNGGLASVGIGSTTVPAVKAGKAANFSVEATIPASREPAPGASAGPFDVVACVKMKGKSGELRCKRAYGKVTVPGPTPPTPPVIVPPTPPATSFTPGSRSLGDPLFPQIGNGGYNALHYLLDLHYSPSTNSFGTPHQHADHRQGDQGPVGVQFRLPG